jgi:hypothetical protein
MAKLVLSLNGAIQGEFELDQERFTIGRKPENEIQIDNLAVSGKHSMIITILDDSFLEDLGSTNGTYVNGKLVKKHALKDGDVIACWCSCCCTYTVCTTRYCCPCSFRWDAARAFNRVKWTHCRQGTGTYQGTDNPWQTWDSSRSYLQTPARILSDSH